MESPESANWKQVDAQVFWGELAPCDHVVQIYENDQAFMDLLFGFVSGGFRAGDAVVVIATNDHLNTLNERLRGAGFDPFYLKLKEKYFPFDAEETLQSFMVDGWCDEALFNHTIKDILVRAKRNGTEVRAFGEMVSILWAKGLTGATVQLEHLWNKLCANKSFCLFCAYPKSGFTEHPVNSILHICEAHERVISGVSDTNDILYMDTSKKLAG